VAVAGLGLLAYAAYRYHRMDTDYLSKPLSEQTPEDHAEWREYLRNTHYIAATGHILGWTGIAILAGPAMGGIGGGFAYFGLAGELIFTGISGMGLAYGIKSGIVEGRSIYRDWDRLEGYEVYERIGLLVVPTLAGIASGGLYGPRAYRGVYKDTGRWVGRWNDWRAGPAAEASQVAPVQNAGRLTFDPATQSWRSTGGLVYGQGSAQGNRVLHVLEHLTPNPSKPLHTLFNVPRNQIIGLLDEAWAARQGAGVLQANGNRVFNIPMGRVVGAGGETNIRIVVRDGTTNVITAFPVP